jgi:O-antigen/teichoic acid export membrane protein
MQPMFDKRHVVNASWTLLDQGLVSLGTFLVNVQLARQLPAEDYGTFALLYSGFLGLQLFNSSLLLYPMSIRLPVLQGIDKQKLQSATLLLVAGASVPLSIAIAVALYATSHSGLILPALATFYCWQMQETMRRELLAEFRHGTAIIGDSIAYQGHMLGVAALSFSGNLTLVHVLEVMATTYTVAAIIQAVQNGLTFRHIPDLRETAREFWTSGSWSLTNHLVSWARVQTIPWMLAATNGPGASAMFQAALNVVSLANPVLFGLCNIIPQTAARAQHGGGNAAAWRAARVYMVMGGPPILGYYGLVFLIPGIVLRVFYGADSPYAELRIDLQLLAVTWVLGYIVDMICAYLHGVNAARFALVVNLTGAVAAMIMVLPLIRTYGLMAGCAALLGANVVRFAVAYYLQRRIVADEYVAA